MTKALPEVMIIPQKVAIGATMGNSLKRISTMRKFQGHCTYPYPGPFILQQQSISSFVEHVRKVLAPHSPIPVTFDLSNPEILVNDERTRSFLTIPAAQMMSQNAPIIRMIRSIDTVMKRFDQSEYYEEAKIHTSIASVPGDVRDVLAGILQRGELEVGGDNRATFMLDRMMLTFGTTKEHCILLEGK